MSVTHWGCLNGKYVKIHVGSVITDDGKYDRNSKGAKE